MIAILTAAIALIAVYAAFSVFTSWLNEQIATFIDLRSKTLFAGIRTMIGDTAANLFINHPLIQSLGEPMTSGSRTRLANGLRSLISRFTGSVVGVRYASPTPTGANGLPTYNTPYVSSQAFATVMTDIVRTYGNPNSGAAQASALGSAWTDLVAGINALQANPQLSPLQNAVLPIWREAKGDYDTFVQRLAGWYDAHMDRVTGWYKRSSQLILLWIASIVVLAANIDTLQIWNGFETNVNLANAVSGIAQAYATANANNKPDAKVITPPSPVPPCPDGYVQKDKACAIDAALISQMPLGWSENYRGPFKPGENGEARWRDLLLKLLGLGITVAALMLGAPFWFDLLGSIVNVRAAGPPPTPLTPPAPPAS
jgi:hypothetical protein